MAGSLSITRVFRVSVADSHRSVNDMAKLAKPVIAVVGLLPIFAEILKL